MSYKLTEQEMRKLPQAREFVQAWFRMLPHFETYVAAYEALEDAYEDYYGRRRYSGWKSFEVVKRRLFHQK